MKLKVLLMNSHVKLPVYATDGAACMDVFAPQDVFISGERNWAVIQTGLKFEVPPGWGMFIFSRSGHGFRSNVCLANCVGVIDSDYRGEIGVKLTMKHGSAPLLIKKGDAIAQFVLLPIEKISLAVVTELSDTVRAEGGFGSTDAGRKYFGQPDKS